VEVLDKYELPLSKLVCTDGEIEGGFVAELQGKLHAVAPYCMFSHVHSVIHQGVLCSEFVNMEHVLALVKK
jgi:hypothetical protein